MAEYIPTAVSATEARRIQANRMRIPLRWERFLGYMYPDTRYLIKGSEGTRKSTLMLKLADMCGKIGPVLYVLAEENLASGTIQARERHAKVNLRNVFYLERPTFEEVQKELDSGKYQFVIIDSVNMLASDEHSEDDIMKLWEKNRLVFFYVMQMRKDRKEYKGSATMRHYVDVVIETEVEGNQFWATTYGKHRFRHPSGVDRIQI